MQQAENLAEVDRLNIIFFGEMDLTTAEKKLRVVMAAALIRVFLGSPDAFAIEYFRFFKKYYSEYLAVLGVTAAVDYAQTAAEHALELSEWLSGKPLTYDSLIGRVRTEVNNIGNLARQNAASLSGKKHKSWKAFGDNKVRPTHKKAAGQTVPINEPFIVGGYKLMFPCDTSLGAGAEEIVNCRCTVEYL